MSTNPTSLDNLHGIVIPDPVSWWPLAPGWQVVILALLIAAIGTSIRLVQKWQKNRFKREALSELECIKPSELPALVKRVALSVWPREQVASLSGDQWLQFLDQSSQSSAFTQGPGKQLLHLSHCPNPTVTRDSPEFAELKNVIRKWVKILPS